MTKDLFKSWNDLNFLGVDALGFFGGFLIRQMKRSIRLITFVFQSSRIRVKLFSLELGKVFLVLNVYGPYEDRITSLEDVLDQNFLMLG